MCLPDSIGQYPVPQYRSNPKANYLWQKFIDNKITKNTESKNNEKTPDAVTVRNKDQHCKKLFICAIIIIHVIHPMWLW